MATCSSADSVLDAASQIKSNATKLDTFVNGTSSQTVQLGTGNPTPSLRKFIADAQDIVSLAANDAAQTVVDSVAENAAAIAALESGKADKVAGAERGNLAALDSSGNLADSGWAAGDFARLLRYANDEAIQTAMDIEVMIDAHQEAVAQHGLQKRLFSGTSPTSASKPVLFVISGQSNAVGCGDYEPFDQALDCGTMWSWRDGANTLKPIKDPVHLQDNLGSWCPAFARRFYALTGRKVILLNIASGGAAITDGGSTATNSWADNGYGTLRSSRQTIWNAFAAAVPPSSYDLGAILWLQGEAEASRLYAGSVTVADYKDATEDILDWTRTLVGNQSCPVLMGIIGYNSYSMSDGELKACFAAIQQAERDLIDYSAIYPGFMMAPDYALPLDYGWYSYMSDTVHYGRLGYRICGDSFARSFVNYIGL